MSIIGTLRHKYALSQQGARDLVKSCLASAGMDIVLMLPVGLLFILVKDLMEGTPLDTWGYVWKIALCLVAIAAMEFFKSNKQFTSVYLESGRRRIALAEKLRRLPLSFFGKKDLADLTSTIMADAATIETGTSHWVPELI
ncbi:MAG: ABC transporter ATP-binding protein, partial [Bacteroidales bacterium]|nr:ABC transporter ATP-binding protein [Bacteroidales bacterium]